MNDTTTRADSTTTTTDPAAPEVLHQALNTVTSPQDQGFTLKRLVPAPGGGILALTVAMRAKTKEATATYEPRLDTAITLLSLGNADYYIPDPPALNRADDALALLDPIIDELYRRALRVLAAYSTSTPPPERTAAEQPRTP